MRTLIVIHVESLTVLAFRRAVGARTGRAMTAPTTAFRREP
jgi:hypothetical protein